MVDRYSRPGGLNLALLVFCSVLNVLCLWTANQGGTVKAVFAALVFSYSNHAVYALLHEAVHGTFHRDRRINDWAGRWAAAFFPTSYRLQRSFHLTHHRNNRSESEQWDYLRPGDHRLLKLAQWYSILTGLYWLFIPLASLLYLFFPSLLSTALLRETNLASQTASDEYLGALDKLDTRGARLDVLFSLAFQGMMVLVLGLSWKGWLLCYCVFAFNWSSLQYADHAFSPLDLYRGAWNLRCHPLIQRLLLNYPLHRAHHQHPNASWRDLPKLVDPQEEPQPGYLENWLRMWKGPERHPDFR